jgi:hypothetical protein
VGVVQPPPVGARPQVDRARNQDEGLVMGRQDGPLAVVVVSPINPPAAERAGRSVGRLAGPGVAEGINPLGALVPRLVGARDPNRSGVESYPAGALDRDPGVSRRGDPTGRQRTPGWDLKTCRVGCARKYVG